MKLYAMHSVFTLIELFEKIVSNDQLFAHV